MKFIHQILIIFCIIDALVIFVAFQIPERLVTYTIIFLYNWLFLYFHKKTRDYLVNGPDPIPYIYLLLALMMLIFNVIFNSLLEFHIKGCVFQLHSENLTASQFYECGPNPESKIMGEMFFTAIPFLLSFVVGHFLKKSKKTM